MSIKVYTATSPAKLLLVDDHPMIRRGLADLLGFENNISVVAEANHGEEALAYLANHSVDLIVLDNNMPVMNGLETLKKIREREIEGKVLLFTVSDNSIDVKDALQLGVDGYLLKDSEPEVLLGHILQASRGEKVFSEGVTRYLANRQHSADPLRQLTERERDVLQEVARGLSNKEVAAILHISEETVKVHIRNLLRKLDVRSRVAATVMWLESRT